MVDTILSFVKENFSGLLATVAAISAYYSATYAREANEQNKKVVGRQSVVDLHNIWKDVNDIDVGKPIYRDVQLAVNALELTAIFWNKGIIEKEIIYNLYWEVYKSLYEKLSESKTLVPGTSNPCQNFVFNQIATAYVSMKNYGG